MVLQGSFTLREELPGATNSSELSAPVGWMHGQQMEERVHERVGGQADG